MSEVVLDFLQASVANHGVGCERSGGAIRVQDGLTLEPRVSTRETVGGTLQVQVNFTSDRPA